MNLAECPAGARLHLGCGAHYLDGWVNTDGCAAPVIEGHVGRPDAVLDMYELHRLPSAHFAHIYCSHVIEHLYPSRLHEALCHMYRALMPGGRLTLATTDIEGIYYHRYQEQDDGCFWEAAIFGACDEHDHPFDAHRNIFSEEKLMRHLVEAGFAKVRPWTPEQYPEILALNDYAVSCRKVSVLLEGVR